MIYKTIMVQLEVDAPLTPRLTFAWELARRFEADLIAFAAAEPLSSFRPVIRNCRRRCHAPPIKEIEERLGALEGEFRRANYDEEPGILAELCGQSDSFSGIALPCCGPGCHRVFACRLGG